ncbi:MAG: hypothetical protein PHZ23_16025 [Acidiphilium sp.]|nr:hypothetical protein [Acidiphilium sp.]
MIQIVETGGHHLVGHMEVDKLAGQIVRTTNLTISGAVSGNTVIMTIGSSILGSISASGTIGDDTMHIVGGSGASSFDITLNEGSLATFQQDAEVLYQKAAINSANAEAAKHRSDARKAAFATFSSDESKMKSHFAILVPLDAMMTNYPKLLATRTQELHAIDGRYRLMTQEMANGLARERGIFGTGQASVARAQLSNAVNDAHIQAHDLHVSVIDHMTGMKEWDRTTLPEIGNADTYCKHIRTIATPVAIAKLDTKIKGFQQALDMNRIPANQDAEAKREIVMARTLVGTVQKLLPSCTKFESALPALERDVKIDVQLYVTEEEVWRTEDAKQHRILAEAQAAVG